MALRACTWIFRESTRHAVRVLIGSPLHQTASPLIKTGRAAGACRDGFRFVPACFITSEAFLNRLTKDKLLETDGSVSPSSVPPDSGEQMSLLVKHPDEPENAKVLKVAVIGTPNAGKSTLSNQLLGRKVFAVSKKVHTTRTRALGVLTEDSTQIILLDTPGLTTPKKVKRHQLEKSLLLDPWATIKEADITVVMVDVSDKWTCNKLDTEVLKCLAQHPEIPAVLVLNKVDLMKNKSKLLEITAQLTAGVVNGRRLRIKGAIKPAHTEKTTAKDTVPPLPPCDQDRTAPEVGDGPRPQLSKEQLKELSKQQGWPHFKDVFMLSSVDKEDVETLKRYLMVTAKPGPWLYHSDVLTDQTPEEVCKNIVREKLLEYLPQEVPYTLTQSIEYWHDSENGELDIGMKLYVTKESHMKMIIGTAGQIVTRMAREAGEDLSKVFLRDVRLKLNAKVKI